MSMTAAFDALAASDQDDIAELQADVADLEDDLRRMRADRDRLRDALRATLPYAESRFEDMEEDAADSFDDEGKARLYADEAADFIETARLALAASDRLDIEEDDDAETQEEVDAQDLAGDLALMEALMEVTGHAPPSEGSA